MDRGTLAMSIGRLNRVMESSLAKIWFPRATARLNGPTMISTRANFSTENPMVRAANSTRTPWWPSRVLLRMALPQAWVKCSVKMRRAKLWVFTRENSWLTFRMGKENNELLAATFTKARLSEERKAPKASGPLLTKLFTKEQSKTTQLTALANFSTRLWTIPTKANGWITWNTERECIVTTRGADTRGSTRMMKNTAWELTSSKMARFTLEIGRRDKWAAKVPWFTPI